MSERLTSKICDWNTELSIPPLRQSIRFYQRTIPIP